MDYEYLINLLLESIQIIGIFVAIIIGLVVSKILSLKSEKDELDNRINELNEEIKIIDEELKKKIKMQEEYYEKDTIYKIIDLIYDKEKYDYENDFVPYVTDDYKKKFYDRVVTTMKKIYNDSLEKNIKNKKYKKEQKILENSIEEIIYEEIVERSEEIIWMD